MKRKFLFLLIVLLMFFPILEIKSFATEGVYNNFSYRITNGEATILYAYRYRNLIIESKELVIPSTIEGCPVTSIEEGAFSYCKNFTNVFIPATVKTIGWGAFQECTNLTSVNLPNGVTTIEQKTFENCTNLKNITIPDSVTKIGTFAFNNCKNLENVKISKNVDSLEGVFQNCESLTNVTVPYGVTNMKATFQSCVNLKTITIPNSVTNIDGAFAWCDSLENIEIPNRVTSIGGSTFYQCKSLTNVNIPNSVTSIGTYAFSGCSSLKKINLPEKLEEIKDSAFGNCKSLEEINIPDSVTSLYSMCFYKCDGLKKIVIHRGIKTAFGYNMFPNPNNELTIYGYKESKVEKFANQYGYNFIALEEEQVPFTDVKSSQWYTSSVQYVYRNNIMTGYTSGPNAGNFGLNDSITRGQIATMLYRLAGEPNTTGLSNPFTDVPLGKYYTEPVKWAFSKGITTGKTATKFDPDGPVTRQELAVFMARYSKEILGNDITSTYNISGIADYNDLSTWARAPMQYIMEKGVITGDMKLGYARILPKNNATRAEAATMFTRFCQNILGME